MELHSARTDVACKTHTCTLVAFVQCERCEHYVYMSHVYTISFLKRSLSKARIVSFVSSCTICARTCLQQSELEYFLNLNQDYFFMSLVMTLCARHLHVAHVIASSSGQLGLESYRVTLLVPLERTWFPLRHGRVPSLMRRCPPKRSSLSP